MLSDNISHTLCTCMILANKIGLIRLKMSYDILNWPVRIRIGYYISSCGNLKK